MASKITEKDNGWNAVKGVLRKLGDKEVVVGIPGPINFSKPTQAAIGVVHEFGSPARGIPNRSYLRSTFDKNETKYARILERYVASSIRGKKVDEAALFVVGETVRGDVINAIRLRQIPQDLKEATKRARIAPGSPTRRGDGPALINTGGLVGSIISKVRRSK